MKSKKLFAILTLVAFMMTLAPMAALAALDPDYSYTYSLLGSSNTNVDDIYDGSVDNAAKFTLTFKDSSKTIVTDEDVTFVIETSNDLATGWVEEDGVEGNTGGDSPLSGTDMGDAEGQTITATPDAAGKVVFYLGSLTATSFKVSVWADAVDDHQIGGTKTVKVEKDSDGGILLTAYDDDDDDANDIVFDDGDYVVAGEGFEVRAELVSGEDDETVTFKQRINGGSWATIGTDDTDDEGVATIWVDADSTGTYEFKATCGSDDSGDTPLKVSVKAGEPDDLVLKTSAGKIALDKDKTVEVYVKDEAGNLVKSFDDDAIVSYKFTSAPADSEWEDEEGWLNGGTGLAGTTNRGVAKFVFAPDEVGTYTIKFKLESDTVDVGNDTETITFECVKQGTIEELSFELKNLAGDVVPGIRYIEEATDDDPIPAAKIVVSILDASGTKITASYDDLDLVSSNPSAVKVDGSTGELTVKDDDFTGAVTITAAYEDDAVVGTYEVNVVGAPRAFKVVPTVDGKTATVKINLVDADGNATISTSGDFVTKEAIKVLAPTGVVVSSISKLDHAGAGGFTLTADEYGEYNVTVTAEIDRKAQADILLGEDVTNTARTVATTFSVDFEIPDAEKPVTGAKKVTMFIGAPGYTQDGTAKVTDVAPFIQDGRTFVAVRPVADAFGAEIGWNEATQTVTLTRSDMTVTIVIGSSAITVVEDGVTTTVTADVAAFIKDGRTVLPFRAVGEAFGATVDYDAATQAVTYEQ